MVSEVEKIAKGLTPRQARALLLRECSLGVVRSLKRRGLVSGYVGTGMAWSCEPVLTTLGNHVRSYLKGSRDE